GAGRVHADPACGRPGESGSGLGVPRGLGVDYTMSRTGAARGQAVAAHVLPSRDREGASPRSLTVAARKNLASARTGGSPEQLLDVNLLAVVARDGQAEDTLVKAAADPAHRAVAQRD